MSAAVRVWAMLSDSEKADIALETGHLPRAYQLLQALDQDLAGTVVAAAEHGYAVIGTAHTRWNPAAEEYEAPCLCGEVFSAGRSADAADRLAIHLEREQATPDTRPDLPGVDRG